MSDQEKSQGKQAKRCPMMNTNCMHGNCAWWTETLDDGGCAVPLLSRLLGAIHWQGVDVQKQY